MRLAPGLADILAALTPLTHAEWQSLEMLESAPRPMPARHTLIEVGDRLERLFLLRSGWAVTRSRPARQRSQILHVYVPGDVIGLAELGAAKSRDRTLTRTDAQVSTVPLKSLARIDGATTRILPLLLSQAAADCVTMRERLFGLSRQTAEERLIQLLLSLYDRLARHGMADDDRLPLPFSQAELGDILGLTSVYVNKLLARLRAEGRISVEKPDIVLHDRGGLARQIGYEGPPSAPNLDWLPRRRIHDVA